MSILVSGSTGFVGSALVPALTAGGHRVRRLVRSEPASADEGRWDPYSGKLDPAVFDDIDAVVHLSGETVAGRWNEDKKRRIMESRTSSTDLLARTIAGLERKPRALICASAIGYYGDRGDERLTEDSAAGKGFLVDVVRAWEAATEPAARSGVRVVNSRFGIVLSPSGGALKQMLIPFKLGVGGPLGDGSQYMSWVTIDDVAGTLVHALDSEGLSGPVNVTAPHPVTNKEFSKTLAQVLRRPSLMRVPEFALKLALGEFSQEALGSLRVLPERLERDGYEFRYPQLEDALRHVLGKTRARPG